MTSQMRCHKLLTKSVIILMSMRVIPHPCNESVLQSETGHYIIREISWTSRKHPIA